MTKAPKSSEVRFRVDPGDVPAEKAARRLHLTLSQFNEMLPELLARGFPPADVTTGMFDLEEIDRWRARRHAPAQSPPSLPKEPKPDLVERLLVAQRRQAEERKTGLRRRKVKPGKHEPPL